MIVSRYFTLSLLSAAALSLGACSPVGIATGAGAAVGVSAAKEGGLSTAYHDTRIQTQINDLWFRYDVDTFSKLDLTVNQGRVLVTGVVQNPEHRVEAIRLAWQPEGVKQVINEVQVADSSGITGYARDVWITTRLRTKMTLDKDVQSINYTIDTVQGVIYLMGVAQSQSELNRVIEQARVIPDVKRVVSYVKLVGVNTEEAVPPGALPADGAQAQQQSLYQQQYTPPPVNRASDENYAAPYPPAGQAGYQPDEMEVPYNESDYATGQPQPLTSDDSGYGSGYNSGYE